MRALVFIGAAALAAACGGGDSGGDPVADATPATDGPAVAPDVATPDATLDAAPADVGFEMDPQRVELHGPCPLPARHGGFKVESSEVQGYTAIDGVVKDGVAPNTVPDEAGRFGDCRLLRARRLVCDPPCMPGETCGPGAACVPQPTGQDLGTVVFRGLAVPVELAPLQPGNTYFHTELPHPGFEPGRVIQLAASGGYLPPLTLYGVGVEPLSGVLDTLTLEGGQPLTVRWQAPSPEARSRVVVEMNIDQHGLTPANLVCDVPDAGEAVLPAEAIDALIAAGVTGFPSGRVTRRTSDSAEIEGRCLDFAVTSVRPLSLEVAGFVPCVRDADCPPPEVCDLMIQQCHDP